MVIFRQLAYVSGISFNPTKRSALNHLLRDMAFSFNISVTCSAHSVNVTTQRLFCGDGTFSFNPAEEYPFTLSTLWCGPFTRGSQRWRRHEALRLQQLSGVEHHLVCVHCVGRANVLWVGLYEQVILSVDEVLVLSLSEGCFYGYR